MTAFTRNVVATAFFVAAALPATAGQSANRTSAGVTAVPQPAAVVAAESPTIARCRQHCEALAASAAHDSRKAVTEKQATAKACLRQMAK